MNPLLGTALLLIAGSWLTAFLLRGPVIRWATRTGYMDHPEGRKDHPHPMPYGGGILIFAAVALPLLAALLLVVAPWATSWLPPELAQHAAGVRSKAGTIVALLGGALVLGVLGYIDDKKKLPVWPRLLAQILAASFLVATDVRATAGLPWPWLQALLTIGFIVLVTNAHNFIDNANGALGGVAAIEASGIAVFAIHHGQWFVAALALCLLGGLAAFLPANFPKPRLFMGDAGAFLVGFLMAGLVIMLRYDDGHAPWRPLVLPLLLLLVPVIDGLYVTWKRMARGVSPFTAGHDHLLHQAARFVGSREKAAQALWNLAWLGVLAANVLAGLAGSIADLFFLPVIVLVMTVRTSRLGTR